MIPRQLTIEGIYSYRNRQVIDFGTLSEAGIFGVFGNVGSGKSAILEAMTYALYGQIERLNDKEQRGYNIMNLQASSLYIDFEFSQDSIEYRFAVTAKRHKKDFNKILSPERTGYRKEGEQWIPLPDEGIRGGITAESIIGLNYEHFRRTVIIPQGKFQEFIQLPPSQRTGMIETLFGLQRFNLSAQSNILLARNREECSFLEGRLDDLQELKNEDMETLEQSARIKKEELHRKDRQKKELSDRLTALTEYRKGKAALEESTRSLEKIEFMKEEILEQEGLLKQSRILEELFKSLLLRERELGNELNEQKQETARINGNCRVIEVKLKECEEYWIVLKKDQENYSALRRTLDSLNALAELEDIKKREDQESLQTGIISKELTASRLKIRELKDQRKSLDSSMEKLEKLVDQSDELSAVEDWYRQGDQLAEKNSDLKSRIDEFKDREKQGHLKLSEILPAQDLKITGSASELEKNLLEDIQNKLDLLQEKEEVQKQKELGSTRLHLLSRMSEELSEGKPCPLCGSDHHPHPHMKYDAAGLSTEQEVLNKERTFLLKQKDGVLGIVPQLEYLEQERFKSENLQKELIAHEKNHLESFSWSFIKADEREQFGRLKAELNQRRFELKVLRQKRSALEDEILILDKRIREKEGE
jgi:DNA repair protein SbcC/Rad50